MKKSISRIFVTVVFVALMLSAGWYLYTQITQFNKEADEKFYTSCTTDLILTGYFVFNKDYGGEGLWSFGTGEYAWYQDAKTAYLKKDYGSAIFYLDQILERNKDGVLNFHKKLKSAYYPITDQSNRFNALINTMFTKGVLYKKIGDLKSAEKTFIEIMDKYKYAKTSFDFMQCPDGYLFSVVAQQELNQIHQSN